MEPPSHVLTLLGDQTIAHYYAWPGGESTSTGLGGRGEDGPTKEWDATTGRDTETRCGNVTPIARRGNATRVARAKHGSGVTTAVSTARTEFVRGAPVVPAKRCHHSALALRSATAGGQGRDTQGALIGNSADRRIRRYMHPQEPQISIWLHIWPTNSHFRAEFPVGGNTYITQQYQVPRFTLLFSVQCHTLARGRTANLASP